MDMVEALQVAQDASPDPTLAIDGAGNVQFANVAARTRWPDAKVGHAAAALFADETWQKLEAALAQARSRGAARFEWGDRDGSGLHHWFVSTIHRAADADLCVCTSVEVTELKRFEDRLRQTERLMVDTQGVAHLGTWEWDVSQQNVHWSSELFRIYGLSPETYTPSYEAYVKMVHPDDRQRVIDATNRVFHEHISYSHDERIFRPDGSIRHLHTWAHPVLDETGTLRRLVGVCQDITVQKLAEEQTRQLNVELERRVLERTRTIETSMRDLEAFNTMVSHDLRAPLTAIQMATQLVLGEREPVPVRVTENIERIRHSTAQMMQIVDDLLQLARVGQAPLERTVVDLSTLSATVIDELRLREPSREVVVKIAPELRCVADRGLMRAVMTNLLSNAWKYSDKVNPSAIEVGTVSTSGRHEYFVRDNGAGFDMKHAHRLFMPFERLHRADDFPGTGVGLTIVHRIVERHGGRVRGESRPGAGATFYFELPPG